MILGWPPSKIVSGDPDFQTRWPPTKKIEKKGDEIKKKSSLKLLSQSQPNFNDFRQEDFYGNFP
jgi:hypothetical protein